MRKLISLAMTAVAVGEGAIALRGFLKKLRNKRAVERGDAIEITTPGGDKVVYKPVDENGDCVDTIAETKGTKPHQEKPSQMGLA
ncbi:MAG: hypothetical protein KAH44_05730 [Oricola sp.]|jgi:hypothetical protein|nr:hypothetical protein [Oricola sp.]